MASNKSSLITFLLSINILFILTFRTNCVNSETIGEHNSVDNSATVASVDGRQLSAAVGVGDSDEEEPTVDPTVAANSDTESSFSFTKQSYNVSIPENSFGKMYAQSTEKMGIHITDPALVVRYKIVGGDFDKIFKAESRHVGDFYFLLIRLRSGSTNVLNREYRSSYDLRIRATITSLRNEALRLKTKASVNVLVSDKNDLSPFFYPESYEVSVAEDIPIDSSIIRVSAVDPDIGLNGEIYYSLSEESLTFAVHPTMGIISATRPLTLSSEPNRPQIHHLTVIAKDRGIHHSDQVLESSKAKVSIQVVPVNKHVPRITYKQHSALSTRSNLNKIYAVLHITDEDSGTFGEICHVSVVDGDDMHLFQITNSSSNDYNIEPVRPYLNESVTTSVFNLVVKAIDCGGGFATQAIVINLNSAKMWPKFGSDHYYTEIHEMSLIGTQVFKLKATDLQLKDSPNLRYNLIDGNDDDVFGITSNGVVFTLKLLDREKRQKYMLVVGAQIGSSQMTTTQLHINVIDDNDNYPVFNIEKSQISIAINENKPNGSSVFRVMATDLDSGDNGLVTYELASPAATSLPFTIDHSTGEIRSVRTLDYESGPHHYQLLIRASDWGEPFRRQTQISLNLTLKDVNDHRPQFERNNCTANIPINTKPWTEIMTFSAIDLDEGSVVYYKMFTPNAEKCFNLNENTGILRLTCNLKEELDKNISPSELKWTLSISATDGHYFSDYSYVKINVVDDSERVDTISKKTTKNHIIVECNDSAVAQKLTAFMIQRQQANDVQYDSIDNFLTDDSLEELQKHKNRRPEFDPNLPKEIYIQENVEKGSKIIAIKAEDPDHGFDGYLIYSLNSHIIDNRNHYTDEVVFNIDQFNGDLFVIDTLDYEKHSKYKLLITACDSAKEQLCANHTLVVVIEDVNDNSPVVDNFLFNVPESASKGHIIGQIYATDEDYGKNALLEYSLKGYKDLFAINPKNGTLTLENSLDREEIDKYILYVTVHDSGTPSLSSTSTVTITIDDVNDNPPRFHENSYVIKVREDMPVGSRIQKITAFDSDEGKSGKIHYSIDSNVFSIDEMTGNIRIREQLDFEQIQIYNITVVARDEGEPSLSSMATLIIEVEDVNENHFAPKFPDIVATATIKENLPIGSFVTKVTAIDDDSDLPVVYEIIGGDGLGRFSIDSNGIVQTAVVLDCETNSHYWLTIVAKDRAAVPLTANLELYINVENENDLPPITTEAFYYGRILENASVGTHLLQVEAHDPDLNSETETKIEFRILNDVPFSIDESGSITTKNKLDRESQSRYVIDLEVSERHNTDSDEAVVTSMISRTPIIVNVIDVNEYEPKAILSIYRCQAYNDISQKTPICQIVAIDRDDDENCVLQYKFIEGNDYNWLSIDTTSGAIYTTKDGIPKGEYDFIISVSDCGTPRKSSQVRLIIRMLSASKDKTPEENHIPVIEKFDSEISISESEPIGYAVTLIKAFDEDNDRLCYHIIDGNIGNTFAFRDAGALIVAKPLSYKLANKYNLTIAITDGFEPTIANLIINLIDVYDDRVSFTQDSYTVNVLENITKGNEILQLSVTDREFSDGIVFSIYSSSSPESLKKFEVESWSGKIKIKEPLDYESGKQHMLVIEAHNSRVKTSSMHSRSFAKVSINIIDVNDETPTFISPYFEATVMETSAIGTSVLQVQAIDKDVGNNAKINYSVISGNVDNVFDIDKDLGFIYLSKPLNARQQSEYYLVIKATDKGLPPLSSTANAHISVSIPDNSPPKFEDKFYTIDVNENDKIGTVIIALKATSRQTLYFEIINGNNDNKFSINVNNGEVWIRDSLDYEQKQNYSLTISATSLVGINDTTQLFINVIDINDCIPYWKQNAFFGHILESAPIGSIILDDNDSPLVVKAEDDDSMHNSILNYSIVEEMGRKYFTIESRTGAISLAKRIDYEKKREFNFTVTVSDLGFPSLKAVTNALVKIECLPVNDCAPVLSLSHYHSTVLLPTYKDVIITTISATDCDFGKHDESHDHFFFSLTPITMSSEKKFSINSTSGLITTSDDRLSEGVYEMVVSVFDGKFTTEAKISINAEPIPRSSLRFTLEKFVGHISENTHSVKTILMPTIEGNKLNEHLAFRILNPTNLFRIARTSGAILSRGIPIDREEKSRYELVIEVRSLFVKNRVAHALVEIIVDDINDNKPVFVGLPYYFVFGNDFQAGTQIGRVQAIDLDVGFNGMVTYSIISGDPNQLFTLNPVSGHISMARSVNSANDPLNYNLVISAKDSGSIALESFSNVTIKMVSGGMPLFDKQYYSVSVIESQQNSVPFLTINAESPHGRQLIYSIVSGNENEEFSLDFNSGMISVIEKLDRESISQYNLIISGTDSVTGMSATVPLVITVDDANDNPPMFTKFSYNVSISEAAPIGTNVVKVSATDADVGLNAKLQYQIIGNKSHFYVSPDDGNIYLKTNLDHETERMHHFTVMATDYGTPVLTSTAHVWVEVFDINDNKPIVSPVFKATIDENIEKGQFVTRIVANDPDSSDINKLRYQILSGNDHLSFAMNETTGVVTVLNLKSKRSRKFIANYELNISVTDGVYSTTTQLLITIKPANNNSPKFTRIFNSVAINELTPIDTSVAHLTATDKDEGVFSQINYHIINENSKRYFNIDSNSGNITLRSELDRESGHRLFWLTVAAQDTGKRIGLSNLRVAITDENDNSPRFIVDEYRAVICSNAPVGATVLPVMAVDDDDYSENNVIRYSIYESQNTSRPSGYILDMFGITSESGHVYTRQNLSSNVGDIVQFFIKASDGSNRKTSKALEDVVPVSIQITGSCPFVKRQTSIYEIFVNENTKKGTVIANVNLAGLKEVELAIVGFGDKSDSTKFRIDKLGRIHLTEQLDREAKAKHVLAVEVKDKMTLTISFLNILINVMDQNDCVPYFDSSSYNIVVSEDQEIGSSIMKVQAIDADIDVANNALKYSLEKNDGHMFSIDENNGWIIINKRLDRETAAFHNLTVGVTDGTHYNSTAFNIQVFDVNDNPPIVSQNYMASIYENSPLGTIIVSVDASDSDENSELNYYILSGDPYNQFEIGQNGEIHINKALDRETIDSYELEIIVTDGRFSTKTMVNIDILDTNDNGPICLKSKYVELVSEAVSPGTYILTVEATDVDEGENAKLYYFISGDVDNHFTIDPQTGHLKTKSPLDRETRASYIFEVHISDEKRRDWTCKSEVEILLSDVNDESPKFSNSQYTVNVPEDSTVGIIVGKVTATDADLGVNRKVRYSLQTQSDEFEINEKNGIIRLAKTLDRESQSVYNLTIKAYDSGASQLYSSAQFIVNVMDINDNAPEFEMQTYFANVSENALIGDEVVKVYATSKDTGINAEIKYHILSGNENGSFAIHSKSGAISVAKPLDYETVREYFMTVRAEDGGVPSLTSDAHVTIKLNDINDISPQFVQRSYDIVIREDSVVGDRIIQLVAIDSDSPENANLTYSFSGGSLTYKEFQIDPISGIITVGKGLDREMISSYILEAVCNDNGSPKPLSSSVFVNIEISDFNDNPPLFDKTNYTLHIQEGRPNGYSLVNFNIQDADSAANSGPFTLRILSGDTNNSFVLVNEDTSLRTNTVFNHSLQTNYSLLIQVFDSGNPPLHSNATVNIIVTQEPRIPPQITPLSIGVSSLEQFPGGIIGQVSASDEDPFDKLSYAITNEEDKHLFSIDLTDGTLVAFPGLDAGKYKINVTVSDGKYLTYGLVELEVNLITEDMVENSAVVELRSVSVKEFVTNYRKTFIRVMKNVFNVRMKDIILISIQPTEHKNPQNRLRRSHDNLGDISVLFAVSRSRGGYYSRQWIKAKVSESKVGIEKQLGILMEDFIMTSECQHIDCKHGECRDELILSENEVISIITSKLSFVSPFHEHRYGCACHPGFGGKLCEVIVNECARNPCPSFKECLPVSSPLGYLCQCPFGKSGPVCNQNAETCHSSDRDVSFCYEELNPISFHGNSYARYSFHKKVEKISLRFKSQQLRTTIFTQNGEKSYNILEIAGGYIQYRFDCGAGEGLIRIENLVISDGKWHEILVERKANTASLTLDRKYRGGGFAPGIAGCLELNADLFFGASVKPRSISIGGEEITLGFIGCLDNILINGHQIPLHIASTSSAVVLKTLANVAFSCSFKPDIGICKSQPCLNGGTCHNLINGSYQCVCVGPKYRGVNCEIDISPCDTLPCLNGGLCRQDESLCKTGVTNCYKCECGPSFTGVNCQVPRFCSSNLCQNGGVCEETSLGPKCHCHNGWHGLYCQYDIDECHLSTPVCHTPATCINLPGTFRCICPINATGISCNGDGLYTTNIISSQLHITIDEIIGILIALSVLALSGLIIAICWRCKNKSRTHRTTNNIDQNERLLKNQNNDVPINLKRYSKFSNIEMSQPSTVQILPQRPNSCADPTQTLNNFDRPYVNTAEEVETNACNENFIQNFTKKNAPVASVSPQMIDTNNKSKDSKKQNKILNDAKPPNASKASTAPQRASFCDSDSNVFIEDQSNSLTNSQNADGYHWDCFDLAEHNADTNKQMSSNLFEVSVNEIHDLESNSDNSQIELSCNGSQDRAFVERDVSQCEDSPLLSQRNEELEIPFADTSEPSSPQKYLDLYLPKMTDNEWNNNKRKNILIYTANNESLDENINLDDTSKLNKDCNTVDCDYEEDSECDDFDDNNQQSTYV